MNECVLCVVVCVKFQIIVYHKFQKLITDWDGSFYFGDSDEKAEKKELFLEKSLKML